jgi:hypothetical protein
MTSSGRASTSWGIVSPRAFAVLKSITSSDFAYRSSPQHYPILATAASVSCRVNARSVSVRIFPSAPSE